MEIQSLKYKLWPSSVKRDFVKSSLIICTYRRPVTLVKLFNQLKSLDDLPDELLIIDGSQNKDSYLALTKVLDNFDYRRDVLYVFAPTGLTVQRNAGIDIARGEIIHFLDDDCLPEINYFTEIEKEFNENEYAVGITGNMLNETQTPLTLKYKIRILLGIYSKNYLPGKYYCNGSSVPRAVLGKDITNNMEVDVVGGASMSFRKVTLIKAGCFSEFFSKYLYGEEIEASLRINKYGKILLCANAKCHHFSEPSSRADLFKRGFSEVYNRYYIWNLYITNKKLKCVYQFWVDIMFLHFYTLLLYISSGFKYKYLRYFFGYLKGFSFVIFGKPPIFKTRLNYFRIND